MHFTDLDKKVLISRRDFLIKMGAVSSTALLSSNLLAYAGSMQEANKSINTRPGIARSLKEEYNYSAKIEGNLPKDIEGFLYRNGPGIFDRDGKSKNTMLEGDGMIQSFQFKKGKVRYRNKFVRTKKFQEEEKAGKFLYSTWTTLDKKFGSPASGITQAGVTVVSRNGNLYAFDEYAPPYSIHPKSLKTIKQEPLHKEHVPYQAHTKIDPINNDWISFGFEIMPRNYLLHLTVLDKKNKLKKYISYELEKNYYMHDFHVTENYIILDVQPAYFDFTNFFNRTAPLIAGLKWNEKESNKLYIFDRKTNNMKPTIIDLENTHFAWHHANAYEEKGEIILDTCSHKNPYHFIKEGSMMNNLMANKKKDPTVSNFTDLYVQKNDYQRLIINLKNKKVKKEVIFGKYNIDFPVINMHAHQTHKHRYAYVAAGLGKNEYGYPEALLRIDTKTGKISEHFFGASNFIGEPIFVPKKGFKYNADNDSEPGYLMSIIYNGNTNKSYVAVLNAENLEDGPIAKVHLKHYSPLSFHGFWKET